MEQIKSALEIALEKTAHLKKASAEEIRQKKQEEQISLAQNTVRKYLKGEYKLKDLVNIIERSAEKDLVTIAVWKELVAAVILERPDNALLEALETVSGNKQMIDQYIREVVEVCAEFGSAKVKRSQDIRGKIEKNIRSELLNQGISGNSVEIDVESSPQWKQFVSELEAFYQARLELIKEKFEKLMPSGVRK